ncbi:NDR1/HIN1-like protein 13 [Impatiens glandulifera]|uniref:NDR1/HIN1-like protein 13 n=1 Tax=Impatiens glandulifera TaxID=253017 RepID=UPI001FB125A9|nr:NDR1/HIN1-like protein 13 [Impatiens glandulifera]
MDDQPRPLPPLPPSRLSQLPPPPSSNTYIIQIPRDQIYRIPPPENEIILRNLDIERASKKKKQLDPRCFYWLSSIAIVLILLWIFFAVFRAYFQPKTPEFSVIGLVLRKGSSSNKHANPSYDITLKAQNPNKNMDIFYKKGGNVSLLFKRDRIGGGEYPSISQESKESTTIHVTLAGLATQLPKEIETRLNAKKASDGPISLSLVVSEPVEFKGLITFKEHLTVTCDFRVNKFALSTKPKIISQECRTNF